MYTHTHTQAQALANTNAEINSQNSMNPLLQRQANGSNIGVGIDGNSNTMMSSRSGARSEISV